MRRFLSLAVMLAAMWGASTASAQSDERARARALFEQGLEASDRGDHAAAEERFRESLDVRRSASAAFNLATLLDRQGHLIEALELYQEVARASGVPPEVLTIAHARIEELAPRLAEALREREAQPDPPEPPTPTATPAVTVTPVTPTPASAGEGGADLLGPGLLFGLGGVFGVAAAVTGAVALDINADLSQQCTGGLCPASVRGRIDDGQTFTLVTDVLIGAAAAAATAGLIWLLVEVASR